MSDNVEIDSLELKIQSDTKQSSAEIGKLTAALQGLKTATKGGAGLNALTKRLSSLNSALSGFSAENTAKLNAVAAALNGLSAASGVKISSSISKQITGIVRATSSMDGTEQAKLEGLAKGLKPFTTLERAHLTTFVNQLGKLPAIVKALDEVNMDTFAAQMEKVAKAIAPLADEMNKVASGFSAFPQKIQRLIAGADKASDPNSMHSKARKAIKWSVVYASLKRASNMIADWVTESNSYVENMNLFTVAMGDGADEAMNFANAVRDAVGIDVSAWTRYQGLFKNIASGFGVAQTKANLMSKNLTQIGYDISSFFNISIEEAMNKVRSGLSGELEPLRNLGYALDKATLQQIAYDKGIKQSVDSMTQAQKSQLRYIAILQQSKNVMGDMARTINTPANALRVFQQQLTELKRALGNLILPILQQILPYVQAIVTLATEAINRWANFEPPEIDYSGLDGVKTVVDDTTESLDEATEAAKKLSATLGIDELNIISENLGSGAGDGGLSYDLDVELPEYDFLKDLAERNKSVREEVLAFFDKWGGAIKTVGLAIATYLISKKVLAGLTGLFDSFEQFSGTTKTLFGSWSNATKAQKWTKGLVGAGSIAAGCLTASNAAGELVKKLSSDNGGSVASAAMSLVGGIGAAAMGGAMIGGPLGALIGGLVGVAGALFGAANASAEMRLELMRTDYYSVQGVAIKDVRDALKSYFAALDFEKQDEWIEKVESSDKAYANASNSYNTMWESIANKPVFDASDISALSDAFDALADAAVALNNTHIESIMANIKTAIKTNISGLDKELGSLLNKIEEAQGILGTTVSGFKAEYQKILKEITNNGGNVTSAQREKLAELRKEISDYTITATDKNKIAWDVAVKNTSNDAFKAIDAGKSKDEIQSNLSDFNKEFNSYLKTLDTKYAQDSATLNQLIEIDQKKFGGALGFTRDSGRELYLNYQAQRKAIIDQYNSVIDQIYNTYYKKSVMASGESYETIYKDGTFGSIFAGIGHNILNLFGSEYADRSALAKEQTGFLEEIKKYKISGYATGGFPTAGQLFFAGEGGKPELVGTMGNQTAVANTEQIVSGITRGVSDANAEQNALLRRQNELLMQILQKEGGNFYLEGREVLRVAEKAAHQRGTRFSEVDVY